MNTPDTTTEHGNETAEKPVAAPVQFEEPHWNGTGFYPGASNLYVHMDGQRYTYEDAVKAMAEKRGGDELHIRLRMIKAMEQGEGVDIEVNGLGVRIMYELTEDARKYYRQLLSVVQN